MKDDNWLLVGLYYERYTPVLTQFGVKLLEGYINTRTKKYKLVTRRKLKSLTESQRIETIENMLALGYSPSECFLVDVAEINLNAK